MTLPSDYEAFLPCDFTVTKSTAHKSHWDINALEDLGDEYMVSVSKEADRRWVIYAEDHEPEDIADYNGSEKTEYSTKKEALTVALEFAADFRNITAENMREDQEAVDDALKK